VKQIRPDALPDASNSVTVGCHSTWMTVCYLNHSAVGAGSMFWSLYWPTQVIGRAFCPWKSLCPLSPKVLF